MGSNIFRHFPKAYSKDLRHVCFKGTGNDHKTFLNYILEYGHHILLSSSQNDKEDVANCGLGIGLYQILRNTRIWDNIIFD